MEARLITATLAAACVGIACTPETPIGSCMVSSEGACAAHYNYGRFRDVAPATATPA